MPKTSINVQDKRFRRDSRLSPLRARTPDAYEDDDRQVQDLHHFMDSMHNAVLYKEELIRYQKREQTKQLQLSFPLHMGFVETKRASMLAPVVDERVYKPNFKALLDEMFLGIDGYRVEEQVSSDATYGNRTKVDASVIYVVYSQQFPLITVEFKDASHLGSRSIQEKADTQMRERLEAALMKSRHHYLDRIHYVFGISCFGDHVRFYRASWGQDGYVNIVPGERRFVLNPWSSRITDAKAVLRLLQIQSVVTSQLKAEVAYAQGRVREWPNDHPDVQLPGKFYRTREFTTIAQRIVIPDVPEMRRGWFTGSLWSSDMDRASDEDEDEWSDWEYRYE